MTCASWRQIHIYIPWATNRRHFLLTSSLSMMFWSSWFLHGNAPKNRHICKRRPREDCRFDPRKTSTLLSLELLWIKVSTKQIKIKKHFRACGAFSGLFVCAQRMLHFNQFRGDWLVDWGREKTCQMMASGFWSSGRASKTVQGEQCPSSVNAGHGTNTGGYVGSHRRQKSDPTNIWGPLNCKISLQLKVQQQNQVIVLSCFSHIQ